MGDPGQALCQRQHANHELPRREFATAWGFLCLSRRFHRTDCVISSPFSFADERWFAITVSHRLSLPFAAFHHGSANESAEDTLGCGSQGPDMPHIIEVNPDKEVVWTCDRANVHSVLAIC